MDLAADLPAVRGPGKRTVSLRCEAGARRATHHQHARVLGGQLVLVGARGCALRPCPARGAWRPRRRVHALGLLERDRCVVVRRDDGHCSGGSVSAARDVALRDSRVVSRPIVDFMSAFIHARTMAGSSLEK